MVGDGELKLLMHKDRSQFIGETKKDMAPTFREEVIEEGKLG